MSIIPVTNMPRCTTHLLWVPEQDAEWTWNHEHHFSYQNAGIHNSLSMSARGGCRMDMKPWAPFQSPTCQNAQLTFYKCQSRMHNGHEIMSTIPVTNTAECTTHLLWVPEQDGQWTWTMSTILVTNMPECTTHILWVPEQDVGWTWDHEHHSSHQHMSMHNSPAMSAR